MKLPFDVHADLSDSQLEDFYDIVPEYLFEHGLNENDEHTKDGLTCENIITKLAIQMKYRGLLSLH